MSNKGGVSIPVYECLFHKGNSITSWTRSFDNYLYEQLPNLYVVCICQGKGTSRKVLGGFFVKTSYSQDDGVDFVDALAGIVHSSKNLAAFKGPGYSIVHARLKVDGSAPLSEDEMLQIFSTQYLKLSTGGTA